VALDQIGLGAWARANIAATPPWAPLARGELAFQALVLRLQGFDVGFEDTQKR
jgi:hypothetical protein